MLGFSIAVSTALDSVLLAALLLTALTGWNARYPEIILENPVAKAALLLFGLLFVGIFHGVAAPDVGLKVLTKYDDLVLVALLLPIFARPQMRLYGLYAFMAAMALTLILSYLIWLGALQPAGLFSDRAPDNPVVFKLHITHGILMSFAAFMFAVHAMHAAAKWRWLLLAAALLAAGNVLLMTQGRTGYLVIVALGIYLMGSISRRRNLLLGVILVMAASLLTYTASPKLQSRIALAVHQVQAWQPMQGNNQASSMGTRMDYYTNAARIIIENPLLGVGTGGFEAAYARKIEGTAMAPANNPHNQFLLFWAQVGVAGPAAFLFLLGVAWRAAARLPTATEITLARGLLITIVTGSLFNSLLLDHTEGLFFAWFCGLLFAGYSGSRKTPAS